jgi:hypothetical protein
MLRTEQCMIHLLVSIRIPCDTDATDSAQITIYKYFKSSRATSFILGSTIIIRQKRTVHKMYDIDCEGRLDFHGIYDGEIDSTIVLFSAETLFQLERDTGNLRATSFLRLPTKCHYNDLRLMCGVLIVRPGLSGSFFSETIY